MSAFASTDQTRPGINLNSPENHSNPYPTYARMREHHPVCQVEPDGLWAISRYEDVKFALKRHDLFSSLGFKVLLQPDWLREDCQRGSFLLMEDPPIHTKHQALISKAFISRVVNLLIPLMRETAVSLMKDIKQNKDTEFMRDFAYPYIGKIIGHISGTEDTQEIDEIRHWVELLERIPPTRPDEGFIKTLEAGLIRQNRYFKAIIKDRQANPRQDIVSELINAEVKGEKLTDDLLRQALDLLISAGFQTTIQVLSLSMMRLAREPYLIDLLKNTPEIIPIFFEEMLRHNPPAHCLLRQTTKAVTLSDVTIPQDSPVLMMLGSANRDPSHFPNPDKFDITRQNSKSHLAFGYGVHACVGAGLVRLELKIALETILSTFSTIKCPEDDELVWIDAFMSHGLCKLPIKFH